MNLHGILSFWGKADIAIFLIRDGQTVFWIENEYGRGMISGNPRLRFAEEPSPGFSAESSGREEDAVPSIAMRNLQQLADEAARTTRNHYLWMALYAVLIFFLAVFAGLTYKHYRVTGELLPLQWLDIESPKAALKSMPLPQTENGMQH
mgnify:CR=1 FL=1